MLLLIMPFPSTIFKELFLLHSILLTFRSLLFSQGFIPISLFFIYLFFSFLHRAEDEGTALPRHISSEQ